MSDQLFDKYSVHDYKERVAHRCHEIATGWSDNLVSDEQAGAEQKAAVLAEGSVTIPTLLFAERTGERRTERRSSPRDGRKLEFDVIDVAIPFTGDSVAFEIAPSTRSLGPRGTATNAQLVLSFPDDEHLDKNVEEMVKQIEGNLQHLARDLASLPAEMSSAIDAAVRSRKAQVDRKRELDTKRSFPIR